MELFNLYSQVCEICTDAQVPELVYSDELNYWRFFGSPQGEDFVSGIIFLRWKFMVPKEAVTDDKDILVLAAWIMANPKEAKENRIARTA